MDKRQRARALERRGHDDESLMSEEAAEHELPFKDDGDEEGLVSEAQPGEQTPENAITDAITDLEGVRDTLDEKEKNLVEQALRFLRQIVEEKGAEQKAGMVSESRPKGGMEPDEM